MSSAPVAVIYTWSTFNYDSQSMQRDLKSRQQQSQGKLKLMGFCLDACEKLLPEHSEERLYQLGCRMQWRNAGRQDFEEVGIHFDARQHHHTKRKNQRPRPKQARSLQ